MAKTSRRRAAARPRAAAPRPRRALGVPTTPTRSAKTYTSPPARIDFAGPGHRFDNADLEIRGIYHGEASYEGRVFLNNPKADHNTARTLDNGYAGSFHIFGHGGCFGDAGHCEVNEHKREEYDWRPPHPLTPAVKRVPVTNALREIAKTKNEVTVTIVPVINTATELCNTSDVFRCEEMRIITYNP
jgi:hypothetical protein